MKIFCQHGFYTFEAESLDDQTLFELNTGLTLVGYGERLTFAPLAELPEVSVQGQPYGNLTAKVNFCGTPAEVMRANGFVFDISAQALADKTQMRQPQALYPQLSGGYIATDALPQAGGRYGQQVLLSFNGVSRFVNKQFILRGAEFENASI